VWRCRTHSLDRKIVRSSVIIGDLVSRRNQCAYRTASPLWQMLVTRKRHSLPGQDGDDTNAAHLQSVREPDDL
jgi:hypothetical protein